MLPRDLARAYGDRLFEFARRLIQTASPPGDEGDVARLVSQEMQALGYDDVWVDAAGNVVGVVRGAGGGASLLLNGHMDHVDPGDPGHWRFPPFSAQIAEGAIWGRGASDDKGALATQVYSGAVQRDSGPRPKGDVYVAAVVMEEVGGVGTRALLRDLRPDFAVIGESTSNQIARGHRGRIEVALTVKGRSGHASAPEAAVNPHYVYARFLERLKRLPPAADPVLGRSSVAPTAYETDQRSTNVIPGESRLFLDWRNIPAESPPEVLEKLRYIAEESLIPGSAATLAVPEQTLRTYTGFEMTIPAIFPSFLLAEDHPLLLGAVRALERALGRRPLVTGWRFATDGGHLMEAGIPTIGFAPGDERLAHTVEDRIDMAQMLEGLSGYVTIARDVGELRGSLH